MAENVFEAVKLSVSTREAAAFYGIEVKRNGMACCPFHDDKNPSMKVDQRFHCFGCGADGDVIDFTAKLFNLSPKEAAEKLAQDFGLIYDSQAPPRRRYVRQKTEAQKFREDRQRCYRVLSDYYHLLKKWEIDHSPRTPEEELHPRFVEAIQKETYVEYLLDLFLYESEEEQKAWIAEHTAEITQLERRLKIMAENKPTNRERLREITDGIEQGIKELFESEKYMRYLSVMSRFHRYSVNNTMLIYMQKPDATLVAGYNKWKDQFERHVKKGEHGITIIAPTPYKKKIEEQKLDPDTKAPILDKDGKIVTEEKEIEIPMFRPVKVFDVSQTDGKPLPELASSLSGIDRELYEAAVIDGANRWKQTLNVTIPGIMPTVVIMLIMRIGSLMNANQEKILLLYNPLIYETSDVIGTFVYRKGLREADYGYSTAVGLFNSAVNVVLLFIANGVSRKYSETSLF